MCEIVGGGVCGGKRRDEERLERSRHGIVKWMRSMMMKGEVLGGGDCKGEREGFGEWVKGWGDDDDKGILVGGEWEVKRGGEGEKEGIGVDGGRWEGICDGGGEIGMGEERLEGLCEELGR